MTPQVSILNGVKRALIKGIASQAVSMNTFYAAPTHCRVMYNFLTHPALPLADVLREIKLWGPPGLESTLKPTETAALTESSIYHQGNAMQCTTK